MRASTIIQSRRTGRRISGGVRWRGVDIAAFHAALPGLILCASLITLEAAKADLRMGQSAQKITSLRADHAIQSHVAEASRRFHIPANWIWAVIYAESAGDVRARSKKGAMGLMQIMPATWTMLCRQQGLGDDPYDPRGNILAGAAYLRDLYDRYGARGFLAAYNAGPGRYEDHLSGRRSLPAETVAYVSTVGRRIDSTMMLDAAPPADERIAARRSALFPRSMVAPSAVQSTDEAQSPEGTSSDQAIRADRAPSRSSIDRISGDLSGIAPSSAGLFARISSR